MSEQDKPAPQGDNAALIAEAKALNVFSSPDAIDDCVARLATALEAAEARVKELEWDQEQRFKASFAYIEHQQAAAGRYGLGPGMLQMAWRNGERSDTAELEWAIVDALAMGSILAWPGDGVACAAHIVRKQIELREAAERQLAEAREALTRCADVTEKWPGNLASQVNEIARAALGRKG